MSQQPTHDQFLHGFATPQKADFEACACGKMSSLYISRDEFAETWYAVNFANHLGYQLNVELVIDWQLMGYTTWPAIEAAYSRLMDLMHKRIKGFKDRWGRPTPFFQYTVFEDKPTVGVHSHSGIHVPYYAFSEFKGWLDKCVVRMNKTGVENVCYCPKPRPEPTTSQWKVFSYAMKGMNPSLQVYDCVGDHWHPGLTSNYLAGVKQEYTGFIPCRRVRRSHAMSLRRQIAAGYAPSVNLFDHSRTDRYSDTEYRRGERERADAAYGRTFGSTPGPI